MDGHEDWPKCGVCGKNAFRGKVGAWRCHACQANDDRTAGMPAPRVRPVFKRATLEEIDAMCRCMLSNRLYNAEEALAQLCAAAERLAEVEYHDVCQRNGDEYTAATNGLDEALAYAYGAPTRRDDDDDD